METKTIKIRQKGVITLPAEVRRRYNLAEGDSFTMIDLGEGALMLLPGVSEVARLGDEAARYLADENVSLEELLATLAEEREAYYLEHYDEA